MASYYKKGNFELLKGDSLELMKTMPFDTFDMVFADPPYRLSNGGFTCRSGKIASVDKGDWDRSGGIEEDYEFHLGWIRSCRRLLKPGGTIWVTGTYHSIYMCGYALQASAYKILNDIVWFKPNAPPNLSCRYFTASHETLLWAKKDADASHTFNYEFMKSSDWGNDFIKKENKQMRSVWVISSPGKSEKSFGRHPTQKPIDLLRRIILASTREGDLILDPFVGSSTTGIAASMTNRRFVGIDIEPDYLDLSIKRLEDLL